MKILLVVDNPESIKILEKSVKEYGTYVKCDNGFEALKKILDSHVDKEPFDLICIDFGLKHPGGVATLLNIRKIEASLGIDKISSTPVFITTASDKPIDVYKNFFQGYCNAYISKSLTKNTLKNSLTNNWPHLKKLMPTTYTEF